MKKLLSLLTGLLLVFVVAGSASAVPTTWTDTIDWSPDLSVPPTQNYWHDISDDGFSSFITGGDDTISDFSLDIAIYDDNEGERKWGYLGWNWGPVFGWYTAPDGTETARVSFGLESETITFDDGTVAGNFWGTIDILHDGTLNVSVYSTQGDFMLDSSTLTVNGDDGTSPVPEPATMMLFGLGLLGLAGVSRKKA